MTVTDEEVEAAAKISVAREIGYWTVRVNGVYVVDFWRKSKAFETAYQLRAALDKSKTDEASAAPPAESATGA